MSCTPPWEWSNCSTASATDNATVAHNASCLPNWGPLLRRYTELGSQGSVLGASVKVPVKTRGGYYQRYTSGRMYWSEDTGAHYLRRPILKKYRVMKRSRVLLGFPTGDSGRVEGGFGAVFERGGIYQIPGRSAMAMWGSVQGAWRASGGAGGPVGLPVRNQRVIAKGSRPGRYVLCREGSVFQGKGKAAFALWGGVHEKYADLRSRSGVLAYPIGEMTFGNDVDDNPCVRMRFENGTIVTREGGRTNAVWGVVDRTWRDLGGVQGRLGVPIADPTPVSGSISRTQFAHGHIDWNTTTGKVRVQYS